MSNDVCQLIYLWTLSERPDPITEVSMGSTMACYKYTRRGFSTFNNTPTHIIAQLDGYTCSNEYVFGWLEGTARSSLEFNRHDNFTFIFVLLRCREEFCIMARSS